MYAHAKEKRNNKHDRNRKAFKSIDRRNGPTTNKLKLCYLPKYEIRSSASVDRKQIETRNEDESENEVAQR